MPSGYRIIHHHEAQDAFGETETFALDVLVGLSEERKSIPSRYMYDAEGSRLFSRIMDMPEYYPTDCERDILETHRDAIADLVGGETFNLVELGAGDGRKTEILLAHFLKRKLDFQYVPIDISESAMQHLTEGLNTRFGGLDTNGLVSEYFTGLKWLNNRSRRRNVVLFLGSSVGNFTHAENTVFLRNLWNSLEHDDIVLIGFDLKKDIQLLMAAYNDSEGITSAFNLNLLRRINSELGGQFDLDKFRHVGTYDVFSGTMQSYLISLETQQVMIEKIGRSFSFRPWEPIHTEFSHKYLAEDIEALASDTGFAVERHLYDARRYFVDSIWRVYKPLAAEASSSPLN
jgi:dimethylhistidine N-methyltransferase